MRVACLVLVCAAGCYQSPALTECAVRCTDGCPANMSCVDGYCVAPGQTCSSASADAATTDTPASAQPCAVEVAVSRRHLCARKPDNTVWCSGRNQSGELGNGTTGSDVAAAVQVIDATGPITDATALGAGYSQTCAVRTGGRVSCWGTGGNGQLGNNSFSGSPRAVNVVDGTGAMLTNIVAVDGGYGFMCALDGTGGLWCWGNGRGVLGDNTSGARASASRVLTPSLTPFTGATSISAGTEYACTHTTTNEIWCWGRNDSGQLGDGSYTDRYLPVQVTGFTATAVSAGLYHACGLQADQTVRCWGDGWHQRIGDGSQAIRTSPAAAVSTGTGTLQGVTAVHAGGFSCAIVGSTVNCWGNSTHGQTGTGSPYARPISVPGGAPLSNVTQVVGKHAHACAYRDDGLILCWGRNTEGEFANGTFSNSSEAIPLGLTCP